MLLIASILTILVIFAPEALGLLYGIDFNGPLLASYDYVIVGCGISGLVVANRLSESRDVDVLCIEAGEA